MCAVLSPLANLMSDARPTVLAVDDVRVARLLTAFFEHDGVALVRAESAHAVVHALQSGTPRAVVVHLASLAACLDATRAARDVGGGVLPVIAIAPTSDCADAEALTAAGASAVLGRPVALARLGETLKRWDAVAREARQAAAMHYSGSVVALPRRATQNTAAVLSPAQRHIIEMQHRFTQAG